MVEKARGAARAVAAAAQQAVCSRGATSQLQSGLNARVSRRKSPDRSAPGCGRRAACERRRRADAVRAAAGGISARQSALAGRDEARRGAGRVRAMDRREKSRTRPLSPARSAGLARVLVGLVRASRGSSRLLQGCRELPPRALPARTRRSSRRRTTNAFMCCESSWSRTIEKDGQCVESGTTGTRARTQMAVAMRRRDRVRVGYGRAR